MTAPRKCRYHSRHNPKAYVIERHHVWPKAAGGPSTAANLTDVDASMHNGVHELLARYARYGKKPSWLVLIRYGKAVRQVAAEGWKRQSGEPWGELPYTLDKLGLSHPNPLGGG